MNPQNQHMHRLKRGTVLLTNFCLFIDISGGHLEELLTRHCIKRRSRHLCHEPSTRLQTSQTHHHNHTTTVLVQAYPGCPEKGATKWVNNSEPSANSFQPEKVAV